MQASVDRAIYLDDVTHKIQQFEGLVNWLYLDKPGLVTVGIGQMLPDVAAAQALPFRIRDAPATFDQVETDFERVAAMSPNHLPTFYLCAQSVTLSNADIKAMLFAALADIDREFRQSFLEYDRWPAKVKMAVIDMRYNLGHRGFMKYKNLTRALMEQDWMEAARESARNVTDAAFAARNFWTRTCFLDSVPVQNKSRIA